MVDYFGYLARLFETITNPFEYRYLPLTRAKDLCGAHSLAGATSGEQAARFSTALPL